MAIVNGHHMVPGSFAKRVRGAEVYNKQQGVRQPFTAASASSTAHIVEQRLHAGDEHLMIASQGLWEVVSPDDAALRMHFHLKVRLCSRWHAHFRT